METLKTPDPTNLNPFAIKKFIKTDDNKHYAVIQPLKNQIKIKISEADYHKGIREYHLSKYVNCYPVDGILKNEEFDTISYRLEFLEKT